MIHKINRNKLLKLLLVLSLQTNILEFDDYFNYKRKTYFINDSLLKIFIMTHKDFRNYRFNPVYRIVADDKSQLKNKYNLTIIFANKGELYNKKRAYGEMSKLYYIYQLYKNGTLSSKYIGLNHYKRYFNFTDYIPNLEYIFDNYEIILNNPHKKRRGMRRHFCRYHICKAYDQILDIIKDIKPEFYKTALKASRAKRIYFRNLFIMKKNDFFKYCEFLFDVLLEYDRRNNFNTDDDILNYTKQFFENELISLYESRLQGFLAERISNIFYYHYFKKIKSFGTVRYTNPLTDADKSYRFKTILEYKNIIKAFQIILISMKINLILLIIFLLIYFYK